MCDAPVTGPNQVFLDIALVGAQENGRTWIVPCRFQHYLMTTSAQEATLQEIRNYASQYNINFCGQVDRGAPIARGGFATVHRGTLHQHGTTAEVALKVPFGCPLSDGRAIRV